MDSPELTRAVVLLTGVVAVLVDDAARENLSADQLMELDALTMLLAHRSRSAVDYHLTSRGREQLRIADQVVELRAAGAPLGARLEIEDRKYSIQQSTADFLPPDAVPELVEKHWIQLKGAQFLHPDHRAGARAKRKR